MYDLEQVFMSRPQCNCSSAGALLNLIINQMPARTRLLSEEKVPRWGEEKVTSILKRFLYTSRWVSRARHTIPPREYPTKLMELNAKYEFLM